MISEPGGSLRILVVGIAVIASCAVCGAAETTESGVLPDGPDFKDVLGLESARAPRVSPDGKVSAIVARLDRRLDEVVFAGTHNAMGAADVPGWMFPNQQLGVRRQLEDGIRAGRAVVTPDALAMPELDGLEAIVEVTGVSYPTVWDADGTAFAQFAGLGLPTTVITFEPLPREYFAGAEPEGMAANA